MLLLSDKPISCCAAGTNGRLDLRRRAFLTQCIGERCVDQMSRLHGTAYWRHCGSIATKLSRLDACEDRKVVRWCRTQASSHNSHKASLMARSVRRVWALRHQTGAQYSSAEWTKDKVTFRNVVAPAPHPESARFCEVTRGQRCRC